MSSSIFPSPKGAQSRCWRLVPHCEFRPAEKEKSHSEVLRSAKYQRATSKNTPEPLGLAGDINSWVLQWLVLCGIPYRGSGALA